MGAGELAIECVPAAPPAAGRVHRSRIADSALPRCVPAPLLQSVMLVELDGARKRTVGVQVVGTQQAAGSS